MNKEYSMVKTVIVFVSWQWRYFVVRLLNIHYAFPRFHIHRHRQGLNNMVVRSWPVQTKLTENSGRILTYDTLL